MPRPTTILLICLSLFLGLSAWTLVHQASPNEWLLVVNEHGEQTKAVVGGTHIASPYEQVVRFPSNLQKVSFRAQQVTREYQGIEVRGFASWVVYREDEGPLKAFRHLNGLTPQGISDANDSIRDMVESIIRSKVANLTIAEVITSREHLRNVCQKSMMEVVKGWGVWIETLEVTEVKILSESLFANMQTQFREETRVKAGLLQLETERTLSQRKMKLELAQSEEAHGIQQKKRDLQHTMEKQGLELELEKSKLKVELERKRQLFQAEADLLLAQEREKIEQQQHEIYIQRANREHEAAALGQRHELAMNASMQEHDRGEREQQHALKMKHEKDRLDLEETMTDSNHRNALLQATAQVYSKMRINDVKLVNFGGMGRNSSGVSDMGLLPGLWAGLS